MLILTGQFQALMDRQLLDTKFTFKMLIKHSLMEQQHVMALTYPSLQITNVTLVSAY